METEVTNTVNTSSAKAEQVIADASPGHLPTLDWAPTLFADETPWYDWDDVYNIVTGCHPDLSPAVDKRPIDG